MTTEENIPVGKNLIVTDDATKLFVGAVAISVVDIARYQESTLLQDFVRQITVCIDNSLQDPRYSEEDRRGLIALREMLFQMIDRIPHLEH